MSTTRLTTTLVTDALVLPTTKGGDGSLKSGVFSAGEVVKSSLLWRSYSRNPMLMVGPGTSTEAQRNLRGEYVFGGYLFPHYGHFLLEACSRLWFAKQRPDLPIVWAMGTELPPFAAEIFELIGLTNPHVFISEPTQVERLHIPDPAFRIRDFCAPETIELLGVYEATRVAGRRVWLSRSALPAWSTKIRSEPRLEQRLKAAGWEIFRPEGHTVREQLDMLGGAEEVAGFAGSAFHTLLLLRSCPKVTIFERGEALNANYTSIAKAKGLLQNVIPVRLTQGENNHDFSLPSPGPILDALGVPRPAAASLKPPNHTVRRVAGLIEGVRKASYLEIGVASGDSFFSVPAARKVAVDPQFRFDPRGRESAIERYFELPSDEYFLYHAGGDRFDLVFIDGLHTFEQAYRDFCNTLQVLWPGGAILIDDTVPNDRHSMIPDMQKALKARRDAGGTGGAWHGDVFKVVFAIHDFHPMLSYATFQNGGNPQTLVWREPRRDFKPLFNSLEKISRLTWEDLQANRQVLKFAPEAEILKARRLRPD